MNAPRLYNLRKEHLAGVRDFCLSLAIAFIIANLKNKEALETVKLSSDKGQAYFGLSI